MKKEYEKPTIEIIEFESEDIMASSLSNGGFGSGGSIGWGGIG